MSITTCEKKFLDAIPLPSRSPPPQSTSLPRRGSNEENRRPENDDDGFTRQLTNDKDLSTKQDISKDSMKAQFRIIPIAGEQGTSLVLGAKTNGQQADSKSRKPIGSEGVNIAKRRGRALSEQDGNKNTEVETPKKGRGRPRKSKTEPFASFFKHENVEDKHELQKTPKKRGRPPGVSKYLRAEVLSSVEKFDGLLSSHQQQSLQKASIVKKKRVPPPFHRLHASKTKISGSMIPALSNVLIIPTSSINASTFPFDDDDDVIFLGGPEEQKNAGPIFGRIDENDDVDDVVWIDSSKEQKNDKSQLKIDEMVKESQGSSSASSTLSALVGRPRGRPRKEKIPVNKVPKKRGRPRKQLGPVNMEALDLILAQPTYGGRPVRKRAWQDLSAIDVFSSSDEEVKRPKASTSRISIPRNVAKNDGKNLQSGARVKKEMEMSLGALTPTTSSRNTSPLFENDASISSSSPWLVVDDLEIGAEEEEQPLSPYLSKRNQEPLRTPVKPRKRVYEDLALPEYDWRLPREDLYEDKDVPLPLNLRDFQHTPRVLPKFKAKTTNLYFLELDAYEEQKEKEKRTEQRRRQANKIQSHGRLRNSQQQQQLQDFPDPLFLSPLEDRAAHLRAEMESLIGRFGGLCDEARELIPDLSKGVVLKAVDQMMHKDYSDSLYKRKP